VRIIISHIIMKNFIKTNNKCRTRGPTPSSNDDDAAVVPLSPVAHAAPPPLHAAIGSVASSTQSSRGSSHCSLWRKSIRSPVGAAAAPPQGEA
jgi:hypothetical protein